MKQITLIRHAKVDIANDKRLNSTQLNKWINEYDKAPIDKNSIPSSKLEILVAKADVIVCSALVRTEASALVLGVLPYEKNTLFNEASIPKIEIPLLKFKPKTWLILLRIMLLLGLGKKDSTLKNSKEQAHVAAHRLKELAFHDDNVVLIGHGGMNWLIHKALIKQGWELKGKASHKNWGTTTLIKSDLAISSLLF